MTDTTARFSLPYILPAQAQKHLTHNEALRQLDLFLHLCIQEDDRATPPTTPNENDAYIIPSIATGAWSGRGTQIAIWIDGFWQFFYPLWGGLLGSSLRGNPLSLTAIHGQNKLRNRRAMGNLHMILH
jgi:hypothetical protein